MKWMIHNGSLKQSDDVSIPAQSRAVAYGDGCFDTIRHYEDGFLELESHLERLHNGMQYLGLEIDQQLESDALKDQIGRLLDRNELEKSPATIRIQVWREGNMGFRPSNDVDTAWMITASGLPPMGDSVSLARVPTRRIPSASLNPSFKLSNSINYIRASMEAERFDADDALMLTVDGYISETTIANIFWNKDNTIYTPNLESDILPGITRAVLTHVIRERSDYSLVKGKFGIEHLMEAESGWICNSLREVMPVHSVDDQTFNPQSQVLQRVKSLFESYKTEFVKPLNY